jgi:hypothetical protein
MMVMNKKNQHNDLVTIKKRVGPRPIYFAISVAVYSLQLNYLQNTRLPISPQMPKELLSSEDFCLPSSSFLG